MTGKRTVCPIIIFRTSLLVKERVFAGRGTHDGKTDAIIARYNPRRMNKVPYPPNGVSPLNPLYTSNMQ